MSSGPVRRVSPKDIQVVQNLIERCLQLYMNRREVVQTLLAQARIEPGFTELVWQKLEEENRDFFKAYYLRLMVKQQIMQFNKLLEQQVQLMHQMDSSIPSLPTSNGSQIPTLHQNPNFYDLEHLVSSMKPESRHHILGSTLQNSFANGGSSLNSNMHGAVDMSVQANRINVPANMIPMQSSNIGLMQGINGGMIKSETGYPGASPYMLGGSVLEARPSVVDASLASFSSVESNSQALNEPLLDADTSSFGFLGHIPRNFTLSDLTSGFTHGSDILENYARSPFVETENETFLDSCERENQGEGKRLDSMSGGMSYDNFGSE